MTKHRLAILIPSVSVLVICVGAVLIWVATAVMETSPSDLLFRFLAAGYVLKETLSQPPMPPPSEVFRKYVINPIPESVTEIKVDKPHEIWGYTYTLRFSINRADLMLLVGSRPFQRVWNVRYENGLDWAWDTWQGFSLNGVSMALYDGRRKPKWFKPELWDNPEAYAFYKVGDRVNTETLQYKRKASDRTDIQVLLYNESEGQAYFIASSSK